MHVRVEPDVVVDQEHGVAARPVDADISLHGEAARRPGGRSRADARRRAELLDLRARRGLVARVDDAELLRKDGLRRPGSRPRRGGSPASFLVAMTKDEPARFLSAFAALMGRGAMIEPSSHAPGRDVKAVVLAAGPGRRLGPLTRELPKTLLPLGEGGTILDLVLANLAAVGRRGGRRRDRIRSRPRRRARPRARGAPRSQAAPGFQRPRRGVEQRALALARARGLRRRRAARERRHGASPQRRDDLAGRRGRRARPRRRQLEASGRARR